MAEEVLRPVAAIEDATVEITLTVRVQAENGFPPHVFRTVEENCRTLKVDLFGFDE